MISKLAKYIGKIFRFDFTTTAKTLEGAVNELNASPLNEWHVSPDGNDSTGNGSEGKPYATRQKAIDEASENDTIIIHAGVYSSPLTIDKSLRFEGRQVKSGNVTFDGSFPDIYQDSITSVIISGNITLDASLQDVYVQFTNIAYQGNFTTINWEKIGDNDTGITLDDCRIFFAEITVDKLILQNNCLISIVTITFNSIHASNSIMEPVTIIHLEANSMFFYNCSFISNIDTSGDVALISCRLRGNINARSAHLTNSYVINVSTSENCILENSVVAGSKNITGVLVDQNAGYTTPPSEVNEASNIYSLSPDRHYEKRLYTSATIITDSEVDLVNGELGVVLQWTFKITGTVVLDFTNSTQAVVCDTSDIRWNDSTDEFTLEGDTDSWFKLSAYHNGTNWMVRISEKYA
jgi:hypothetical protein